MEQENHHHQEMQNPETLLGQYAIENFRITAPWLKFNSLLLLIAMGLTSSTSCKKDDEKNDEEFPYGTVELLQEGGQSPLWSPDGERIAYLEDEKLYVMNTDGSDNLLLTSQIHERMKWSPSGTELAYHAFRGGPLAIYKIGVDGNNEVKLTGSGHSIMDMDFSWSPDGGKIAYGVSGTDKVDLYIINNDGSGNHKVDIPIDVFSPSFTPGGSKIMFRSFSDIGGNVGVDLFFVEPDGSNLQKLAISNINDKKDAQMRSDESKIYFSGSSSLGWNIYEVNPDGSNLKNLTNGVGNNHQPHISPDGKYIAFLSYRDEIDGLLLMHADGSDPYRITKGTYRIFPGSWSPDSRKLVFDDKVDGVQGIYVLTLK